jgi:hypothetical protein
MPDDSTKVQHALDGAPAAIKTTRGASVTEGGRWATCRNCGSTLYPQRRESRKLRVIGGQSMLVDKYRCGCLTGREVRRELAA